MYKYLKISASALAVSALLLAPATTIVTADYAFAKSENAGGKGKGNGGKGAGKGKGGEKGAKGKSGTKGAKAGGNSWKTGKTSKAKNTRTIQDDLKVFKKGGFKALLGTGKANKPARSVTASKAAPSKKEQVRYLAAQIFALHRRDVRRRRRKHGAEALEARHVVDEPVGKAQGEGGDETLQLQKTLVGKIPSGRLVDRLDRALMRVALAKRRDGREAIEQLYELLARLEFGLDVLPLRRLL